MSHHSFDEKLDEILFECFSEYWKTLQCYYGQCFAHQKETEREKEKKKRSGAEQESEVQEEAEDMADAVAAAIMVVEEEREQEDQMERKAARCHMLSMWPQRP